MWSLYENVILGKYMKLRTNKQGLRTCLRVLIFPVRNFMYLATSSFRPKILNYKAKCLNLIQNVLSMTWNNLKFSNLMDAYFTLK